jgi:dihydroorotase
VKREKPAPVSILDNVRVVDPSRNLDARGHLVCREGRILACAEGDLPAELRELGESERRDGTGRIVVPGLWDMRVHFREPGFEDRETIATGCAAAVAGGFTDVVTMPNTRPRCDTAGTLVLVRERGERAGMCRVHPAAAITLGLEGKAMCEYGDLVDAGAVAFTDDHRWVADGGIMRHAMEYSRALGVPVISHPEDHALSREGCMHEGPWSTRLGLPGLPTAAEVSAVARDIELARLTGAHLHVPHVSCRASVQLIRNAKSEGLRVSAETAPHLLCFTDADCSTYDTNFKMRPPLRSAGDQEALVEGLMDGTIDVIASDHAPHTVANKERSFAHAPFGVIGLETSFAACHDRLVRRGRMSLLRLVELMSTAPARIMGKPGGSLEPGRRADFTLIDVQESWVPRESDLRSKGRNCPWLGSPLTGRVLATYVEGNCVYELGSALQSTETS